MVQLLQWSCGEQMLHLRMYPEKLLVLFLPFFAKASLSRHASQVRLRVVPLLPLISQNHRMVGVGRDLWSSSSPTPLLKQVHLEPWGLGPDGGLVALTSAWTRAWG